MIKNRLVFEDDDSYAGVDAENGFKELQQDELDLFQEKRQDYVGMGDPFGNFNRIANILANYPKIRPDHPLFVGMFSILKHWDCIMDDFANNREPNEQMQNRLKDISVFCKLMVVMLDTHQDIFPMGSDDAAEDKIISDTEKVHGKHHEPDDEDDDDIEEDEEDTDGEDNGEEDEEEEETEGSVHDEGEEEDEGDEGEESPIKRRRTIPKHRDTELIYSKRNTRRKRQAAKKKDQRTKSKRNR